MMNEKIFLEINGAMQGMFLRGENTDNPVLLYLHGGAGSPDIAFTQKYPTGLEKLFTVCWWEQRGSGISYSGKIKPDEMTVDQLLADTITVTNYLRKRFDREKIYLMGHSWGSFLGVKAVEQHSELFHAYIGIGQVSQQDRSERLAYSYMLEQYSKENNKRMVKKLKKFSLADGGEITLRYLALRSKAMNQLGIGIMHDKVSMMDCVSIVLKFKGYTLREKFKYVKGSVLSLKALYDATYQIDLKKDVPTLPIPVYIFQGKYDYQVSYELAKEYAKVLNAPVKGFYTFENSAHSPCFEEPEKMCKILREDILQNKSDFADKL